MINFDSSNLSGNDMYKLLTGSVVPRPIAWITTRTIDGTINAAPFSFFNVVSSEPPLIMVSIVRIDGNSKDTARNILDNGDAVIHIVSGDMVEEMNVTAASLAPDMSELELAELCTEPSDIVNVPRIKGTKIQLEAKLKQYIPITDEEGGIVTDLLLMQIVKFHFDEEVLDTEKLYILDDKLDPISRLSGNNYGTLGELFSLERPE